MGFLKVPEFSSQLLVLPIFPQTSLYQTEKEQNNQSCYDVAGIKLTPIVPNKEYRIEYSGKMVLESDCQKVIDVQLNTIWHSNLPTFNFSTDISRIAMSEAMALEPWTKQYFDNLKRYFDIHFNCNPVGKISSFSMSFVCILIFACFCLKKATIKYITSNMAVLKVSLKSMAKNI